MIPLLLDLPSVDNNFLAITNLLLFKELFMSSDIYVDFRVFTAKLPDNIQIANSDELFPDPTIVIVMSKSGAKNTYPFTAAWKFDFIGGVSEFNNSYLDEMAYYFDDGLAQSKTVKNGAAFKNLMTQEFSSAKPLTAQELIKRGIEAYVWDACSYNLISNKEDKVAFVQYDSTRYATKISSDDDILQMIIEATQIKNEFVSPVKPYMIEKVWSGRPNPMDIYTFQDHKNKKVEPVVL